MVRRASGPARGALCASHKRRRWRLEFLQELDHVVGVIVQERGRDVPLVVVIQRMGEVHRAIVIDYMEGPNVTRLPGRK